jgi:HEAT repeat protein
MDLTSEAIGPLSDALASPNPWTRLHAAEALDRLGPAAHPAQEALERARADEHELVRIVVEHALGRLK